MSKDMVNMNGKDDPFYRYTMPRLQIKVEGTTKMIKTVLCNIEAVAACVGRPVDYLVTFYGQELCVASKIESLKAYVTGKVEQDQLQAATFKFINSYVMCGSCNNPETTPSVCGSKKKQYIELSCKGCGAKTQLDALDKFVKYMVVHPMDGGVAPKEKKKKKDKKDAEDDADESGSESGDEKPVEKTKKKKGKDADSLGVGVVGELDRLADEANAAAAAAKKEKKKKKDKEEKKEKEKGGKATSGGAAAAAKEEDSDSDWAVDVSAEAVAKRAAESEVGSVAAIAAKAAAVSLGGAAAAKPPSAPSGGGAAAAAKAESSDGDSEDSFDLDDI